MGDAARGEVTRKRRRRPFEAARAPDPVSLPFRAEDVAGLRLLPSELARFLGVSKQTVSRWKRAGRVAFGADGRCDPVAATRSILESGDLDKIRARILRAAVEPAELLRERVAVLQAEVLRLQQSQPARDAATHRAAWDDFRRRLNRFLYQLQERFPEAIEAASRGEDALFDWLADLEAIEIYQQAPASHVATGDVLRVAAGAAAGSAAAAGAGAGAAAGAAAGNCRHSPGVDPRMEAAPMPSAGPANTGIQSAHAAPMGALFDSLTHEP